MHLTYGNAQRDGYENIAPLLLSGADLTKDQSYFLSGVVGSALSNAMFPYFNWLRQDILSAEAFFAN